MSVLVAKLYLVITETTQKYSLAREEIKWNLIDEKDDTYASKIVIIPTQVLFRMKATTSNWKWKNKRKQQRQKERYSRKMKMKKKIASMIMNATNEYPTSEENVSKENETKGILKLIDRRKLTKKKRVPNQWPDHPT